MLISGGEARPVYVHDPTGDGLQFEAPGNLCETDLAAYQWGGECKIEDPTMTNRTPATPIPNTVLADAISLLKHLDGHSAHRSAAAHCRLLLAEAMAAEVEHGAPARLAEAEQCLADLIEAVALATGRTLDTTPCRPAADVAREALREVVPILGASPQPAANGGPSLAHVLEAIKAGYPSGDPRSHSFRVDGVRYCDDEGERKIFDWPPPVVGQAVEVDGVTCVVAFVTWHGAHAVVDVHTQLHYRGAF
jgi:hypothetical protein